MAFIKRIAVRLPELLDNLRREDVTSVRRGADPTGKRDGRPEQVVVVVNRFACRDPDPYAEVGLFALRPPAAEASLDRHGAVERIGNGIERRHDSVAGVLDL